MAEAAVSAIARTIDYLRTLLSESAAWQAACGVGDAAAALPRIVRGYADADEVDEGGASGDRALPFVEIECAQFSYVNLFDDGTIGQPSGGRFTMVVYRTWDPPSGAEGSQRPADEYQRYYNIAGSIVEQMMARNASQTSRVVRLVKADVAAVVDGEESLGESASGVARKVGMVGIALEVEG